MLGEVAGNHITNQHRLHGFTRALGRQCSHHPPGEANIDKLCTLEAPPVLAHPPEVSLLKGLRQQLLGFYASPPRPVGSHGTCFKGAGQTNLPHEAAEAGQGAILGGAVPHLPELFLAPGRTDELHGVPALREGNLPRVAIAAGQHEVHEQLYLREMAAPIKCVHDPLPHGAQCVRVVHVGRRSVQACRQG